jgi:O-antigen ligase/lipoprotein NlpI
MIGKFLKWFFILVPFIYFDGVFDASGTPRLLFLSIGLLIAYSICFLKKIDLQIPREFAIIYVLYIFAIFLNSLFYRSFIDYAEIIKRIDYFLFFILVFSSINTSGEKHIIKGLVSFLCTIIFIGLLQLLTVYLGDSIAKDNFYAISATFSHKNIYAAVLVLSIPFVLIWEGSRKHKILLLSFVFLFLLVLQTRSAFLALLVSSLYLAYHKIGFLKKNILPISVLSLVVFVVGVLLLKQLNTYDYFASIFDFRSLNSLRSSTISERMFLWENSFKMFCDHWLLGVGVGNWAIYFPFYGLTLWRLRQGEIIMQRPHNDVLENFNEIGLIGGALFACILLYPLLRKSKLSNKIYINFGLISFVLISLFSFPQERIIPSLLFFTLIAFNLKHIQFQKSNRLALLVVITLLASFNYLVFSKLNSEKLFKSYLTNQSTLDTNSSLAYLNQAKSSMFCVDGTSTPIDWYIGELHLKDGNISQAKKYFEQALSINPNHIHILNSLGGCSLYDHDFEIAQSYFKQALDIAPYYEDALYNISYTFYKLSDNNEAIFVLKNIYNKDALKFNELILNYAKSEIVINLSQIEVSLDEKEILVNLLTNDDWVKSIVLKSYDNQLVFEAQLDLDINYMLSK